MSLDHPLIAHPPASGFYAVGDPVAVDDAALAGAYPQRRYVEGLLRTGDLFLADVSASSSRLHDLLAAVDATIPLRALALVEPRATAAAATTRAERMVARAELDELEARGRAWCTYFEDLGETLIGRGDEGAEIALPIVDEKGEVVAVLAFLAHDVGTEADLAFLDAVAGQLSAALARDRRAASVRAALESTASALAAAGSALRRLGFMADASAMLGAAVDPAHDLTGVARLVSRRIADGCVLEIGPLDALRRTAASTLSEKQIDRAARLVSRVFVVRTPLVAILGGEAAGEGEGWREDSEAESARSELGLAWIACVPVCSHDGEMEGAALLFGEEGAAPLDATAVDAFARLLGVSLGRARPYRAAQHALRERDRVLSIVAHDFRQPLNSTLLNLGVLMARGPHGERRSGGTVQVERIKRAIGRLARLAQDLLDVSTFEHSGVRIDCASVSVDAALTEVHDLMKPLAEARGIHFHAVMDPSLPAAWADSGRVQQVLQNLVGNAIKFTPAGGTIRLDAHVNGSAIAIAVADDGPGIREADRRRIFDRFWQARDTARQGAGIGLTIAKAIVEAHGGSIAVAGAKSGGTIFTFTLPMAG